MIQEGVAVKFWLLGIGVFAFMVVTLFTARFQIVPTPMQYGFCVLWSAMLSWSIAVIMRRMANTPVGDSKSDG